MKASWQTPEQLLARLRRRWERRRGDWLGGGGSWPQGFALGAPSEQQAAADWQAFQDWLAAWAAVPASWPVQRQARRWPALGVQALPERLRLESAAALAELLDEGDRWRRADARWQRLTARWPRLADRLRHHFELLADAPEAEFERLIAVFAWLVDHPDSGLWLRQLPIPGVHSKWIEARQAVLSDWLAAERGVPAAPLHVLAGLRQEEERLRMRLLDPALRAAVGGLGEVQAAVSELAALRLPARRVLIVENLQTGLACGELAGSVLFMGLGYALESLKRIPWLRELPIDYWGDIDTHGLAILSRLRGHFPQVRSLLMDESTLLAHRELWSEEAAPARVDDLPGLSVDELALYRGLRDGRWGPGVRLEQERVGWGYAWSRIACWRGT